MVSDPIKKPQTRAKNENTLHNIGLYIMPQGMDRYRPRNTGLSSSDLKDCLRGFGGHGFTFDRTWEK